jgi:hypothetical protein
MPIFKLNITIPVVVEADNEAHARRVAEREKREIFNDAYGDGIKYSAPEQVRHYTQLPEAWDAMCFPYGGARQLEVDRIGPILQREAVSPYESFGGV